MFMIQYKIDHPREIGIIILAYMVELQRNIRCTS